MSVHSVVSRSSSVLSRKERSALVVYVFFLTLFFNVARVGVASLAVQFILKDTLHLKPEQSSVLGFLADIPFFIAFVFGFLRDRWKPFRWGDRGYFLLLPPLMAGANLLLAFGTFTYDKILIVSLLTAVFVCWLGAAMRGLMTILAQSHGMAGRFSVMLMLTPRLVTMAGSKIGGQLAIPANQHLAFLISALLCLPMMLFAFWKPQNVFAHEEENRIRLVPEGTLDALVRLLRHHAIYLPAVVDFLWAFAPGWGTPLFFYMTNTVKVSEGVLGNCNAIQGGGTLVAVLAYMWLCSRITLRSLLWGGTFLGVLGCPLYLLVHSVWQAYAVYFLAGVSVGIAVCAYNDLLFRCCPKQLEGAALMFSTAMGYLALDTSDIFGSWLYEKGGFILALVVSTLFTGLIFTVLPFVPKALTAPREGEALRDAAA